MSNQKENPVYEKLLKIRESESVSLKPCKFLRETLITHEGDEVDFNLRTYQVQMVYHMLMMKNFVCGDDTGLGKTLETIATLCYLWEKEPDLRPIVLTTTSAMRQWGGEIDKFTDNVDWVIAEGGPSDRAEVYEDYFSSWNPERPRVLIMNYPRLRRDWRDEIRDYLDSDDIRVVMIGDEATAFKSTSSKTHKVCKQLAEKSERVYGLTATLIKNNLEEGYGIYKVVNPDIFRTKTGFLSNYCVTRLQPIGGGRKVKVIVGHSKDHINLFKSKIDPYYLGRAKHHVAKELPLLTTKEVSVPMSYDQWDYYTEALTGLLTVNQGTEDEEEKETTKLTQLIYCQQIANDPYLIGNEGEAKKVDLLMDMIEGEFSEQKVIVFSRFRKMVDRFQEILESKGFEYAVDTNDDGNYVPKAGVDKGFARVTGSEDGNERDAGRIAFTETEETNIIFLTMAGAEAMNLQQAQVMIFFDLPWSAGDYLQLVGRMIRIGSPHQNVYAIHLISEGPFGDLTIDHHVTKTLDKKMGFIEGALGERIVGNENDEQVFEFESDTGDIFASMLRDAEKRMGSE
jgi:SNF2 family DNA or RNA helicase